jgi:hypothetical protein
MNARVGLAAGQVKRTTAARSTRLMNTPLSRRKCFFQAHAARNSDITTAAKRMFQIHQLCIAKLMISNNLAKSIQ